jgi:hypothetical protein
MTRPFHYILIKMKDGFIFKKLKLLQLLNRQNETNIMKNTFTYVAVQTNTTTANKEQS